MREKKGRFPEKKLYSNLFVLAMSYLVIQIGHCGNRLGQNFFTTLSDITSKKKTAKNYEFLDKSDSRFFSYSENEDKKYSHAILLDRNPPVIQDLAKPSKGSWCYKSDYCKLFKPEPLYSWPLGYKVHGPSFKEFILETVRREVECYDQFYGFLLFGSVSGFISSGIVSYITELIRNEFPTVSLANISVWPYQGSMGCSEMYNAVLNLSTLQNFSDAVFFLENDNLMKLCMQKMGMKEPCEPEYNLVASYQLANLLLPVDNNFSTLNDMLSLLVPHPQFKFINLQSVPQQPLSSLPFCSYDWSTLFRSLRRMLLYSTSVDEISYQANTVLPNTSLPATLTNLLLLRGRGCESADINYLHKPQFPYASWVPKSSRMNIWTHSSPYFSCDRTALLANNGQLSVKCVDKLTENVWKSFAVKACFKHLEKHGLTEEEFFLSLMEVQQIVSSYKSLKA